MSLWLNIIGVGEKGVGELSPHLRELITEAFTVIGPFRFLASVAPAVPDIEVHPELVQQRSLEAVARALLYVDDEDITFVEEDLSRVMIEWQGGIDNMLGQILPLRGSPTVILATGDPMWFGIGATLANHLAPDEFAIHTHPAAARMSPPKNRTSNRVSMMPTSDSFAGGCEGRLRGIAVGSRCADGIAVGSAVRTEGQGGALPSAQRTLRDHRSAGSLSSP